MLNVFAALREHSIAARRLESMNSREAVMVRAVQASMATARRGSRQIRSVWSAQEDGTPPLLASLPRQSALVCALQGGTPMIQVN